MRHGALLPKIPKDLVESYRKREITLKVLAKRTGRSVPCAFQHLVRQGYTPRTRSNQFVLPEELGRKFARGEMTTGEVAEVVGCSIQMASNLLQKIRYSETYKEAVQRRKAIRERKNKDIFEAYAKNSTLQEIADKLDVSRQRVQQMIQLHLAKNGVTLGPYEKAVRCCQCKEFMILCSKRKPRSITCPKCSRGKLGPLASKEE